MPGIRHLLLVVALLVAACGGSDGAGDPETDRTVPPATELVAAASARLSDAASFAFALGHEAGATVVLDDIAITEADGVVVRPDRLSADLVAEVVGQRVELGAVGIADTVWLTNPFDRESWTVVPGVTIGDLLDLAALPGALDAVTDLEVAGESTIDGVVHDRVTGEIASADLVAVLPSAAEPGATVGVELLLAVDAPDRLGRVVLTGPLSPDDDPEVVRVLDVDDLDVDVTIDPPE